MSEHELWNELGNLYFMSGAYNQAANAYQRSIQSDTEFGRPYSNLALTFVQQGKYDEAIELYRRSIELLADNQEKAISLNRLGNVYRHLKDYSKAVVAFQQADDLDPHSTDEFPPSAGPREQAQQILSSVLDEPVTDIFYERVETLTELPVMETADEPVAVEAGEPVGELAQEPAAMIVEQPVAEIAQEPVAEVMDEPLVMLPAEPVAEIVDEPIAASVEEPVAERVDEPLAVIAEEPIAEPVEEVPAAAIEEPVAQFVEEPVAAIIEEPVAQLAEEPVAAVMEEPVAAIAEEPAAEPLPEWLADFSGEPTEQTPDEDQEDVDERMTRRLNFLVGEALDQAAMAIAEQPAASNEPESEPELEWWDVDEERFENATHSPQPAEDPSTSWTPADLSQFQQDISQMPDNSSLTAWGDDDFERWSPLDPYPDADADAPDPDSDNISTWLPVPEEAPLNVDELHVPPFFDELEEDPELPSGWEAMSSVRAVESSSFAPVPPVAPSTPAPVNVPLRAEATVSQPQAWQPQADVAVEERPAQDFAVVPQQRPSRVEVEPAPRPAKPELVLAPAPAAPAPEPPCEPDRDEAEMREIQMGIEKFRRVVQLNPRNAHAWDALGTLYKSAGQYTDAIFAYQQAISNDGTKSLYYHHLGLVYACEHRDEDAITAFQRVIEIDPEYSLAHATLGGYYRKMGYEELAQKHIGKAMKNIFDSENEYNRACLEAICGNADQAIKLLDVALKNKQTYVDWILRDPDLDFIRQDPRFKQLISRYTR